MRIAPLLAMLMLAAPTAAPAREVRAPEPLPTALTRVFAETCMRHFYEPNLLRDLMQVQEAPVMPAESASRFLRGRPGIAWAVLVGDEKLVLARRDDGMCTVFAQHADIDAARRHFASLVAVAPTPLTSGIIDGAPDARSESMESLTYAWSRPADASQLVFTFSSTRDADAPIRAMVSMALVQRSAGVGAEGSAQE